MVNRESPIQHYEFRILGADSRAGSILCAIDINGFSAIRRAQSLFEPGQGVEVRHGMTCTFARNHRPAGPVFRLSGERLKPFAAD
jgi:hypothetical protein